MTTATKTMTKEELRKQAEALVEKYNEAIQDGKYDIVINLNEEIEQAVNEYTAMVRKECFDSLKTTDDPMLAAVRTLTYKSIHKRDKKPEGENIPVRSIEDIDRAIDLLKLHKFIGGDGIGAEKSWSHMIEKFNFLMTAYKAKKLGIDPTSFSDSYAMSDIAQQMDMGKTLTSNTSILKALQAVITAMLGEGYKATSHDVEFLTSIYTRKNRKALTVTCSNHRYLRHYITEICHRIALEKDFKVEFKQKQS